MRVAGELWRAVDAKWKPKRFTRWVRVMLLAVVVGLFGTRSARADGNDDVLVPEGEPASILDGASWTAMDAVSAIAYGPDGKVIATGSADKRVRLWDIASGRELRRLEGHTAPVTSIAFSPDGQLLASGSTDRTVRLWDVASGREIRRFEGHTAAINSIAISRDGKLLASGSSDTSIRIWDLAAGQSTLRFDGHTQAVNAIAFSPDGGLLVSGSSDKTVRLWSLSARRAIGKINCHSEAVTAVAFAPNGQILASASSDKTMVVSWAITGEQLHRFEGHSAAITAIAFSPDNRFLVSGSDDGTARLWNISANKEIRRFSAQSGPISAVAFSPDGWLLALGLQGSTRIWDIISSREVQRFAGQIATVTDVAFSDPGHVLAFTSMDKAVRLWDFARAQNILPNLGQTAWLDKIAFGADSRFLGWSNAEKAGEVWDIASSEQRRLVARLGPVVSAAFGDQGKLLALGSPDGTVRLWDVTTGTDIRRLEDHAFPARLLALSHDGKVLASSSSDDTIRLWDVTQWHQSRRLVEDASSIRAIAFSFDDKILASGGSDRSAHLWDLATGRELGRIEGHTDAVTSIAFSLDNARLASGSDDGSLLLSAVRDPRSPALLFRRTPTGWLSTSSNGRVYRNDDGRVLYRSLADGALEPVLPPEPDHPPDLHVSTQLDGDPGDGLDHDADKDAQPNRLTVTVANAAGAGRAYWIRVEPIDPPPGLRIFSQAARLRLDAGQSADIPVALSWVSPDDPPVPRSATLRLKVVHAHGETPPYEVSLNLRTPVIGFASEPHVDGKSVRFRLINRGDQASGPLAVSADFYADFSQGKDAVIAVSNAAHETRQSIADLASGQTWDLAFPIPSQAKKTHGRVSLTVHASTDVLAAWDRIPPRMWVDKRFDVSIGSPLFAYLAITLAALLLLAATIYLRIYRHPFVVRVAASPTALAHFPLPDLPSVDRALRRARRLTASLTVAALTPERWQRALRASTPGAARLDAFAESLGATLGEPIPDTPPGTTARAITLPALRLRFAEQTAIALVEGRDLEPGAAARLASIIHRNGAGPRQALVLDLTATQQARARLRDVPSVAFVVLSADRLRDLLLAAKPAEVFESTLVEQVKIAELSPYQTAGGVEQEALFFGRERELRTIADRKLRNFLLVGPRQMGKSTLLKAVERRLRGRAFAEVHYVTLADHDVTAHLVHHLDRDAAPGPSTVDAFRAVAAGTVERPRLWLLDEADRFVADDAAKDHAIARAMRQLAQDGLAYFVLAGYWHLYAAAVLDRDHPLLNFAEVLRLGPLDPDAARDLATEPAGALGLRWDDPGTVEHLIAGAGRRANLIVLACKAMIESLGPEDRSLTRAALDRTIARQDTDLADALRVLRAYDLLDRILVAQSFLLGEPTPDELRAAIRDRGITAPSAAIDQALDRLRLGYLLVPGEDGRLACPVPFVREAIERGGTLEQRLQDDVADFTPA